MLENVILDLIASEEGTGIRQSDIWKQIGIDSRTCSRIITRLEDKGLIIREWETVGNTRTYRVWFVSKKEDDKVEVERLIPSEKAVPEERPILSGAKDYTFLLANDTLAPCMNCNDKCTPETCIKLTEWINLLL
ncbi:MAG: B-block binding subunit of TFIIIC [Candidatus Syntrophoarchaeum caldarius]|uniref:B-block binding subunit of TFIIIC n=1 Tax=Candidatus Syntropharchaeum caldarium TaxID=1838285 RepID=A0A1F2PC27_9EURY|nr:MAG: B-block binding subunit of TFIIIC [Candidatus Syntrophoarchaeum caldarius]